MAFLHKLFRHFDQFVFILRLTCEPKSFDFIFVVLWLNWASQFVYCYLFIKKIKLWKPVFSKLAFLIYSFVVPRKVVINVIRWLICLSLLCQFLCCILSINRSRFFEFRMMLSSLVLILSLLFELFATLGEASVSKQFTTLDFTW